jgi:FkbM family methyltransferase
MDNIYKSQNGQDKYIVNTFFTDKDGNLKKDGYFIDIGAHDGVEASASYAFEFLGWDGICIEPLPKEFEKLQKNRKSLCINATISDLQDSIIEFLEITGNGYIEMLSGIYDKLDPSHISRINWESTKPQYNNTKQDIIKISNYRFNDLIPKKHINFLSIDTEGCDIEILNSIDYNKYDIDVICFEDNGCSYEHKLSHNITNNNLIDKYTLVGRITQDFILVNKIFLAKFNNLSKEGLTELYL